MRRVLTLCYHKVSNDSVDFNNTHVSLSNFEDQIKWIKANYTVIPLDCIEDEVKKDGKEVVAVSFDDGYADVYNNALPILEKYSIPATVFVTTGYINSEFPMFTERLINATLMPSNYKDFFELNDEIINCRWNTRNTLERMELYRSLGQLFRHLAFEKRSEYERVVYDWAGIENDFDESKRCLNVDELKKLAQNPLISIGSHTVNHVSLKWISKEQQQFEIEESKRFLETLIGKKVDMFAYPWGSRDDYTDESKKIIEQAGYKFAFTTSNYSFGCNYDRYQLPRLVMCNYELITFKELLLHIEPCEGSVDILLNNVQENDKLSEIVYIGRIEDDYIISGDTHLLIWGYGNSGKELYYYLSSIGAEERVIGFGENDAAKVGISSKGKDILSIDSVIELQREELQLQILVCGMYNWEICFDLAKHKLHNIHVLL